MESLILLAVLVCPVVMGTMMFVMWRGRRHGNESGGQSETTETQREPEVKPR